MVIYMYSDGSRKAQKSSSATIILSNDEYLGTVKKSYRFSSCGKAELFGLLQGLKYVQKHGLQKNKVVAKVDHQSIKKIYDRLIAGHSIPNLAYKDIWEKVFDIVKKEKINLSISYIRGHSSNLNTNNVCDSIAGMLV